MTLRIYNTLTRNKDEFKPITPPKVGMYVCGVTVYDLSHIGHARSTIAFDVIYRYLRYKNYDVNYVRNFTDIDDKIINRAAELDIDTGELTTKYIAAFKEDMSALGLLDPTHEPHCTDYVEKMVVFIEKLVADEYAYPVPSGDVYYRVDRFKGYGKLSGKNVEDLRAGARVEVSQQKESPLDFVLWKASKPGEPKWDSPWGEGRPGWHIECSVMSNDNIGDTLDIHGGGKDLMFPHHENEIAQSEAYTGKSLANVWIHNGFVNVPSEDDPDGTKMSKSLGNFYTIRDVLAAFHPQTVKFFMLSTHYRKDVIFTEDGLSKTQDRLAYLYKTLAKVDGFLAETSPEGGSLIQAGRVEKTIEQFEEAMDDDFNTQRAFGQLSALFKLMNELVLDQEQAPADLAVTLLKLRSDLKIIAAVLGVYDLEPAEFENDIKALQLGHLDISTEEIENLIAERGQARADKNWARSDEIRDLLADKGVLLLDSKEGTSWSVKS